MSNEKLDIAFQEQLEDLRNTVGEAHGLADLVDTVYEEARLMSVGDMKLYDARYATLRIELTADGFRTNLLPKGSS